MVFEKMARNTKKKLAIFAGTSKCLIYAEAKHCASEMPGEVKYYECSRSEYCCGIGCCVSPGLHFHHLWYYWILVIIMFLVCSGGGWWYRYWLQGRYRAAASAIPARASNARAPNNLRGSTCQGQRARITYNSARNTVLLHRMWKGPQRNGAVPAYNAIGNATTSAQYQNMSVVLNDANCPYYQLYGPPPSYETVIAQTRGKPSTPGSPELARTRTNAQSPSIAPASPYVPQCFSYTCNFSARLNDGEIEQATRFANGGTSSRPREPREGIPFAHFPPYCAVTDGTVTHTCVPFVYQQPFVPTGSFDQMYQANSAGYVPYPTEKSSDAPEASNANAERYTMVNVDCVAGSSRGQAVWRPNDRSIETRAHGGQSEEKNQTADGQSGSEATGFPSLFKIEGLSHGSDSKSDLNSTEDSFSELTKNRRVYGGSLKVTGRYAGKERCEEYSVQRPFSKLLPYSCDGLINTEPATARAADESSRVASSLEDRADVSVNSFQSNPSNNVILACSVSDYASSSTGNVEKLEQPRSRLVNASTNSNLESKHRLDRSKSLD